jgi:hypothetical protein
LGSSAPAFSRFGTAPQETQTYEFTWNGSAWQRTTLGTGANGGVKVQSIPAGARADNLVRIYAAAADGGVDEFSWTGSIWQTQRLGGRNSLPVWARST